MNETLWYMLTVWLALMILGYGFKKNAIVAICSVFGLYLGLVLNSIDGLLSLAFFVLNIYTALTSVGNT